MFLLGLMCGIINAFASAIKLVGDDDWFWFHFIGMFICGVMAYNHFWWCVFKERVDVWLLMWKPDDSPRYTYIQKALDFYHERDLAWAFHYLRQAEREDKLVYERLK